MSTATLWGLRASVAAAALLAVRWRWSARLQRERAEAAKPASCPVVDVSRTTVRSGFATKSTWSVHLDDAFMAPWWISFSLGFDCDLDAEMMRKGLEFAITEWPRAAARLSGQTAETAVLRFDPHGEDNGVEFAVQEVRNLPQKVSEIEAAQGWVEAGALDGWRTGWPSENEPLLYVRLVKFTETGSCALAVRISHLLGDSFTYVRFLETWARGCDKAAVAQPGRLLPCSIPSKVAPIASMEELREEWSKLGLGRFPLMTPWRRFCMIVSLLRAELVNKFSPHAFKYLTVNRAGLDDLKKRVCAGLPDGEWVSSHDLVHGILCTGRAHALGHKKPVMQQVSVTIDMRGRTKEYQKDYLGNAVVSVDLDVSVDPTDFIATTRSLHDALRQTIRRDLEDLSRCSSGVKALLPDGKAVPLVLGPLTGKSIKSSTWTTHPWMKVSFGGAQPTGFRTPPGFLRNFVLMMPLNAAGDIGLLSSMPEPAWKRFSTFLQLNQLPLHLPK
ncbi:Uncharacterized protein SCF082_LOCUS9314 [Durusdinium trenchii]|uniref:Diacylglycerol O-acyltransferase n=1 Tax=Durusdinium trenchii TaxID=1381693 RepID=A0ABP0IYB7_9DINO